MHSRPRWARVKKLVLVAGAAAALLAPGCARECGVPLSTISCAPTFDEQAGVTVLGECATAGACGNFRIWRAAPASPPLTCVYDSTGQHLVSATECSDVPTFCDRTAFCVSGGQAINVDGVCNAAALPQICAVGDGGGEAD